ncbi:spinster family MFS transporter [Parasphingopyxis marina]|uniref:MFS transporter n=1 Tax=Parasphingopyxis marina TaxID=2761622 RepID=A0A842HTE1_9SPHN|nr:MFS transporter [Parasphingopyxis marina]MBC2777168.1 MFS transporter [Parasphingopyxis marina]
MILAASLPGAPAISPARSWWAIFIFTVALMFNFLDRQLLTLLITPIKADLNLSDTQISLLVGFAFVVFYVGVGIPISRLVDRGPRKWIVGFGIAFWSLCTAGCGLAQNFFQLVIARMCVGIGESCNGPATYSMTADMFPRERLATPISVINIGMVAGSGMALLIGGWLIVWLTEIGPQTLPVLGTLKPWQMTFLIVGLPGVLWAILLVATVPEPPRREVAGAATPSFVDVLKFLRLWATAYGPMFIASGVKAMLSFGTVVWSPAFFERQFGYAPGEPGPTLGIIALIVSPIGLLLGGWIASRMAAKGIKDANMRMVLYVTIPLVPIAILYPLMPQAWMAFALLGCSLFLGSLGAGPANAAMQTITPGRMRGTTSALYIAIFNVLGYGAGPLVVALLTDNFYGEAGLGSAMASAAIILGPIGLILSWMALKPYGRAVLAAEERGD